MLVPEPEGPARSLFRKEIGVVRAGASRGGSRASRLYRAIPAMAVYLRRARPRVLISPGNHAHVAVGLAHLLAARPGVSLVVKITNPVPKAKAPPAVEPYP